MSLAQAFVRAKNLSDLTASWMHHLKLQMRAKGIESPVHLKIDNASSLVAPAALVATVIANAPLGQWSGTRRVLLLGSDPMIRIDRSAWASLAGDMLGRPGSIEILQCFDEDATTTFGEVASALGIPPCTILDHQAARAGGTDAVDLALWVHPATEALEPVEVELAATAVALAKAGVPTFAACFNPSDLHAQNYLLHEEGVCFEPLGGEVRRGTAAINRFGISTEGVGVEGGWGAVLSQVRPCAPTMPAAELDLARAALQLRCIEGAIHSSWQLGQRINGVAFNRIIPLGLLGNMALDPASGHIFTEDFETKELRLAGHLWGQKLKTLPSNDPRQLMLWASEVKLSFQMALPKEDRKRAEAIELLRAALSKGVLAAGIALARCYEVSAAAGSTEKAAALYREVGERHPLSAYHLAHEAIAAGALEEGERLLRVAADFGYPVAQTDLGKLLYTSARQQEALQFFRAASVAGDVEASFSLGELNTEAGLLPEAMKELRNAWMYGHAAAAELAVQIAQHMYQNHIGKRSLIKRELREAQDCLRKLQRRTTTTASPMATPAG